ncbi:MAG: phage-shock protein [Deltaproteobacteria bacterium]|nr:phage-shock protein [Deltaproteobacteria bacterium]MBW1961808.1 phage-shock protein [Deltaproteobacteria bacterium]MBW1994968.1 phage-shock protein [Deltaproteobacteria bacterium]MBW2152254.1 phage-shock protein [Deltaproteobacteria bacterium]
MEGALIVSVVFGSAVLLLAIIAGTVLFALRILKGQGISRKDRRQMADEARMVQEIYQGMSELENRVEALETILLDGEKKDCKK